MLWISCRQDLNGLNEAFGDPNLYLLGETFSTTNDITTKGYSLAKENSQNLISVLHPELKQAISDCIRKNNILFQVSGEDSGLKTWYIRYFESLFHWHDVPRRSLATQSIAIAPAPNLGLSIAPAPSPTSFFPRLSPASLQSPASLPSPLPSMNNLPESTSPTNVDPRHKGNDKSRTIIIACVVTAVVTLVVAALFFILCCRGGLESKQNDDRPLLSLSLSDFSSGMYFPHSLLFSRSF